MSSISPFNLLDQEPEPQTQSIYVTFWIAGVTSILGLIVLGLIAIYFTLADDEFDGPQTDQSESGALVQPSQSGSPAGEVVIGDDGDGSALVLTGLAPS